MIKRLVILPLILSSLLILMSCESEPEEQYTKNSDSFFDAFDTVTQVVGYTGSEEEFNNYFETIHARFGELHQLYDIYNNYEGINNIKTINDNAGVKPVKVEQEIIDLILFAKEWYAATEGSVNIAMGPVLKLWHDYRTEGMDFPEEAELPPMERLQEAAKYTDIDQVIVDTENSTVFLADSRMRLDVGAVAKGFATEIVAQEIMAAGMTSGIISSGGNVRVLGKPLDGIREKWGIGLQDPSSSIVAEDGIIDTVYLNNASVVSSGDYQRYYIVDGEVYHHIIDPKTLMPGNHVRAVTVITENSGLADFLSTAVFLMPYDHGYQLVESLDGVEALWVLPGGEIKATEGMKEIMKSYGATPS